MPVDDSRLAQCFQAVFPSLTPQTVAGASTNTLSDWDSVAGINLLTIVEEEFAVRVEPEEFVLLTSYGDVREYLNRISA